MLTDHPYTRRTITGPLATTAVGACASLTHAANAPSQLITLGQELDHCHAARRAFNDANPHAEDPFYEPHWELREKINGIPALTYEELCVKARSAEYAFEHDRDAECDVPGSFVELSRSLAADLLRLQRQVA